MSSPVAGSRGPREGRYRVPAAIWILGGVSLLVDLSSELLYPILPIYLASVLGTPMALIGFIEGVAEVTAGFSKGYFGSLSDRWRRRKGFVVAGYTLSALMKPVPGVWTAWAAVLAARTLDRLGKGVRTAPRDALLAAYATPATLGRVFGLHRALDTTGAALGPMAALLWLHIFPGDYRGLFFVAFGPALAGAALTLAIRERRPGAPTAARASVLPDGGLRAFWAAAPTAYRRLVGCLTLFALANSSDVFLILKVREAGLGDNIAVGGYVLYNLVYAAAAYPAGRLSDRVGRRPLLVAGLVAYAAVYLGFAAADSAAAFAGLFVLYGLYAAATEGVARAWVADLIPAEVSRGRALGLHAAATSLAALVASTGAGVLWSVAGPTAPFALSATVALLTAAALLRSPAAPAPT